MTKILRLRVSHMFDTGNEDGPDRLEAVLTEPYIRKIRKLSGLVTKQDLCFAVALDTTPTVFNPHDSRPNWEVDCIRLHVSDSNFWWEIALGSTGPYEWTSDVVELEELDTEEMFSTFTDEEWAEKAPEDEDE